MRQTERKERKKCLLLLEIHANMKAVDNIVHAVSHSARKQQLERRARH